MFRRTHLTIALLSALAMPGMVLAQDGDSAVSDDDAKTSEATNLETVSVTGSRIARSQVEGPAPVFVITADDLQKQGFSTVRDALVTINQSTGDVNTDLDQTGGTPNGQFVNLRGVGPGYTLVLLNGKRMANYPQAYDFRSAAVSLSSIPAGAVERIEVLSGGSSAIYGSDAVAGVINIITKNNYDGHQVRLRAGTTTEGGGNSALLQLTGGKTGQGWSTTYAVELQKRDPIMAYQRDFMDSTRDNPAYRDHPWDAPALDAVYLNIVDGPGYVWPDASGALSGSTAALFNACTRTNPDYEPYRSTPGAAAPNRCGDYAYSAQYSVQNEVRQLSALLSGNYSINNTTQAYFNALASKSGNRSYNSTMFHFYMSPSNVYDPDLGTVTLRRRFTPGEIGHQDPAEYDERAFSINAGVRGTAFDNRFDWDANVSYSDYDVSIDRRFFATNKVRDYFLGELQGYTSDGLEIRDIQVDRLFSPMTRDIFNATSAVFTNRGSSSTSNIQFSATGDLFELPAGTVMMAAVVEAGREKFNLDPDERTRPDYTGDERIFNWTAVTAGGSRDRYAVGVELNVPVFSSLNWSLAGRYDRYNDASDVGGAFTWQTGLEWRPLDSLLLRASHATSFRAPDMTYLYTGSSSNFYWLTDIYRCRLDGIDPSSPACTSGSSDYYNQVQGTYAGNLRLEEETGKSTTFGVVWDIVDSMSLSADFYRIELNNAVAEIDRLFLMQQEADCRIGHTLSGASVDAGSPSCQFYMSLVGRNDGPGGNDRLNSYSSYPINQSLMRTEGVDVAWRYGLDAGSAGRFNLKAGYTIVTKLESQLFPGDEMVNERDDKRYRNFRSKANWQLGWNKNDWTASVYGYRWGSLPNYANTERIAPYIIWNASLSRRLTPKATLGLNVNNVFNSFHPKDYTYTSYPYFYRSYSPVGRQIYAEFTYDF